MRITADSTPETNTCEDLRLVNLQVLWLELLLYCAACHFLTDSLSVFTACFKAPSPSSGGCQNRSTVGGTGPGPGRDRCGEQAAFISDPVVLLIAVRASAEVGPVKLPEDRTHVLRDCWIGTCCYEELFMVPKNASGG
jgi:hypothetical protein